MELFEKASRLKWRFYTPQGAVTVEDLWDLPLSSPRSPRANLDEIAIELNKQIQEQNTTSFVKKTTNTRETLQNKFDLVLHIISVRQAEATDAETKQANAQKKAQILELIANKENESLGGKSIEELQALAASL